jgi:peptidoglycan hydrolase-like protein with peptidoglycan-binding domain
MYDRRVLTNKPRASARLTKGRKQMKKLLTLSLLLCLFTTAAMAQTATSTQTGTKQGAKRGPVFRATKDQINQAQAILKSRGFYSGEQIGKLDEATRDGLRKYQNAEGLKVTGTLNRVTLEKMNIALTEKQKSM